MPSIVTFGNNGLKKADATTEAGGAALNNNFDVLESHLEATDNPHSVSAAQVGALANVVDDTTPQLGGTLDPNGNAVGYAKSGGTFAVTNNGLATGYVSDAGEITSSSPGSLAGGYCDGDLGYTARIEALGRGSLSFGWALSYGAYSDLSTVRANGNGSVAVGTAGLGSMLLAQSGYYACFAFGGAYNGYDVKSYGSGSMAVGYSGSSDIVAGYDDFESANIWQFGPGTNTQPYSMQIGDAGLRFKGTTGAPSSPQNGDIYINNDYVYIRSNGAGVKIT